MIKPPVNNENCRFISTYLKRKIRVITVDVKDWDKYLREVENISMLVRFAKGFSKN